MTDTQKIHELRQLIIEGNIETNEEMLPSKSKELYRYYWDQLIKKVEEVTGEKIDFCYYYFPC